MARSFIVLIDFDTNRFLCFSKKDEHDSRSYMLQEMSSVTSSPIWSICWLITSLVASVQTLNSSMLSPWFWMEEQEPNLWRYCQYHEQLIFEADPKACANVDCWESQLTDKSRFNLVLRYNIYRYKVAIGLCQNCARYSNGSVVQYQNMNFMEYHWYLELVAQYLLKRKCEFSISATPISLNVARLRDAQKIFPKCKLFEYAATSMPYTFETQAKWMDEFSQYLDPKVQSKLNPNILNDWSEDKTSFRRGTANFFGCAIAVRNGVSGMTGVGIMVIHGRVLHLLCVYATWSEWYTLVGPYFDGSRNCNFLSTEIRGLDKIEFVKDTKHKSAICRRATLLDGISSHSFIEDIPCAVYSKALENSTIYRRPCRGAPTRTWLDSSLPNFRPVVPFSSKTLIDDAVIFELQEPPKSEPLNLTYSSREYIEARYDKKYCIVLFLFYFIVVCVLFVVLSLLLKYKLEKTSYELLRSRKQKTTKK